jgi:hypothetical protein
VAGAAVAGLVVTGAVLAGVVVAGVVMLGLLRASWQIARPVNGLPVSCAQLLSGPFNRRSIASY